MARAKLTNIQVDQRGIDELARTEIAPWLQSQILEPAATEARGTVNVDSGLLRSTIGTAILEENGQPVGFLYAGTNYAIWQETEPGDAIPGGGTRRRGGGKPFLRPAVMKALAPYTR